MKILILQNRMGIGDMIMFLPFIEAISKKFKTPVTILAKKNTKIEMYFNNKEIVEEIMYLEREDKEKDAFVHVSAIKAAGMRFLNEGDKLEFTLEDGPKGPSAVNLKKLD